MGKRLALVGVGKWGANFLRTVVETHRDEITLIVSTQSREKLDAIARHNARLILSISQIDAYLNEIDVAIVATPPDVRPTIVRKFLRHGVPVLAEKPLSFHAETSTELVHLARTTGVRLIEDFIHLYSWPYLLIQEQLAIHPPILIESEGGNWGPFRDYSPLFDYAPHDLAMALQVFSRMPDRIHLDLGELKNKLAFTANIKLDFAELGTAKIAISNISPGRIRRFRLEQKDNCWIYDDNNTAKLTRNGLAQSSTLDSRSPMQLLLDHFCERKQYYEDNKTLWLSQSVAEVLQILGNQYDTIINDGQHRV